MNKVIINLNKIIHWFIIQNINKSDKKKHVEDKQVDCDKDDEVIQKQFKEKDFNEENENTKSDHADK